MFGGQLPKQLPPFHNISASVSIPKERRRNADDGFQQTQCVGFNYEKYGHLRTSLAPWNKNLPTTSIKILFNFKLFAIYAQKKSSGSRRGLEVCFS